MKEEERCQITKDILKDIETTECKINGERCGIVKEITGNIIERECISAKEEWIKTHIKNADKLDEWIKQAELGETVEVLTTEIDESFPMGKVLIYGNIASTFPSAFDEPSKMIYINIDKPSDYVSEILNIKDKTIQTYYALLHEVEHLKWAIDDKPLNLYSPETEWEKYYSHPSEVAAREASDAFLRRLLDEWKKR